MCGICGIAYAAPNTPIDVDVLRTMRDTMIHRGPDEAGLFMQPGIGLGHRRLSIIDLSPAGRQPMPNEDETVWLVFNGEIYNYRELRRGLVNRGHAFRSHTDSEVIVHLYEERGPAVVEALRGMFAFALWDVRHRRLLLARDRLGIKPLYYAETADGSLVFGSEIKAVLASEMFARRACPSGIVEFLASRYTTGVGTLYEGVSRLPPGHTAMWETGRLTATKYWDVPRGPRLDGRSPKRLVREFADRFEESVRLRMISDAPIGVFLSGGLDSSAIAAVMAAEADEPINSFSVAFAEREANELMYARAVARALGARHHEILVSPAEYFEALPRLIWHEDEPMAFPSSVPLYFVSRLAAGEVKVVLTGEGSDELLAGYAKYARALYNLQAAGVYRHAPEWVRTRIRRRLQGLPAGKWANRLRRTFLARPGTVEDLYLESFGVFGRVAQHALLTGSFRETVGEAGEVDPWAGHRRVLETLHGFGALERLLALDWLTYLQELLMKQDQMSMAASVESRVPFLDHEFVAFAAALPSRLKLRGFATKRILKMAMRDRIPEAVLTRSKRGFPTPLEAWLRGRYGQEAESTILSSTSAIRDIVEPSVVRSLFREHREKRVNHTERLWALLNLEMWLQVCVNRSTAAPPLPVVAS